MLAHAAFKRFGYVAVWERSPKSKEAWIRRMAAALDAVEQAHVRERASRRERQVMLEPTK